MHPSALLTVLAILSSSISASPTPQPQPGTYTTTFKRPKRSTRERGGLEWAKAERDRVLARYNPDSPAAARHRARMQRRQTATGSEALTDINADESYLVMLDVGTPAQQYPVVLDTGSSDFWMLGNNCNGCAQAGTTTQFYSGSGSSTFDASQSQPFGEQYGSGAVNGTTATETVTVAGVTVVKQPFGVVTAYQGNVVGSIAAGLMGMAFSSIATIGTPWWQNSVSSWAQPLFTFALARQADNPTAQVEEPGGIFSIGATDSTLFTGNINYVNIPQGADSFWQIPIDQITMQGGQLPTTGELAAIDTGTTLIAGPTQLVDTLYSTIPGVQVGRGQEAGLYFYPCSTAVNVTMTFGGVSYTINPVDFSTPIGQGLCYGAFFSGLTGGVVIPKGSSNDKRQQYQQVTVPDWIVGDVFLKNVYTVFRATPPSVGFATLANPAGLKDITTGLQLTAQATATPTVAGVSVAGGQLTTITTKDGLFGTVTAVLPVQTHSGAGKVGPIGGLIMGLGLGLGALMSWV